MEWLGFTPGGVVQHATLFLGTYLFGRVPYLFSGFIMRAVCLRVVDVENEQVRFSEETEVVFEHEHKVAFLCHVVTIQSNAHFWLVFDGNQRWAPLKWVDKDGCSCFLRDTGAKHTQLTNHDRALLRECCRRLCDNEVADEFNEH